jgi:hypothetical protein
VLCGALWATFACAVVRRDLRRRGVQARVISTLGLPKGAGVGVAGAMTRLRPSCLEKALILQKWGASQGNARDVVVGVPKKGFGDDTAHAWLEGESEDMYVPIYRFPAPVERRRRMKGQLS